MRKFNILLIIVSLFLIFGIAEGKTERTIKVGLITGQSSLTISLGPEDQVFDLSSGAERLLPVEEEQVIFTYLGNKILINEHPVSKGPIIIKPGNELLNWNDRQYRGQFIIIAQNKTLSLINHLTVEQYLRGVLPGEVPPEWPSAVLRSQVIAARTYTMASINRHNSEGFDVCASTHCHVYGGATIEDPATDQAIINTAGKVITYDGKIITAVYHASSGGFTENPLNIWGFNYAYLKPVLDWDQNSPYYQWTRTIEWKNLQVQSLLKYPQIGTLRRIQPTLFGENGRILKINLIGDLGEISIIGEHFRYLLNLPSSNMQLGIVYGPEPNITLWWIRSTSIPEAIIANNDIPGLTGELINPPWDQPDPWAWLQDKEPLRIVVKGSGWGHRVGMSQWGAKGMAEAGFDERQILEHYYPEIKIIDESELKS